jgi:UDP-3-O-[3-hydroxymyristoyl] glucosamine N-acyltransferase
MPEISSFPSPSAHPTSPAFSVKDLSDHIGGTVVGDSSRLIERCCGLESAGPKDISFVSNIKYLGQLSTTRAGCVVVGATLNHQSIYRPASSPLTLIKTADPYFGFRQIMVLIHGLRTHPKPLISPLCDIAPSAQIGNNCYIAPFVTIGENCKIGDRCVLYSGVQIMAGAQMESDCILYPNAVLYDFSRLGKRVIIQSGAVIGCDGYGFATHEGVHHKIPQAGNVVLCDDVEVGANTVIERAAMESTLIGEGTKIGNNVVVGHNCQIGHHNLLVSQVGMAGSSATGNYVVLAGQVGVAGHLRIGDHVRAAAQSGITSDIEAGRDIGGTPAMDFKLAKRVYLQMFQLPEIARRLRAVEAKLVDTKGNQKNE